MNLDKGRTSGAHLILPIYLGFRLYGARSQFEMFHRKRPNRPCNCKILHFAIPLIWPIWTRGVGLCEAECKGTVSMARPSTPCPHRCLLVSCPVHGLSMFSFDILFHGTVLDPSSLLLRGALDSCPWFISCPCAWVYMGCPGVRPPSVFLLRTYCAWILFPNLEHLLKFCHELVVLLHVYWNLLPGSVNSNQLFQMSLSFPITMPNLTELSPSFVLVHSLKLNQRPYSFLLAMYCMLIKEVSS